MKKTLLTGALLLSSLFAANAQQTLFEDGFESYTDFAITGVGQWVLTDVDASPTYGFQGTTFTNSGAPFAYIVFNSTATTPALEPSENIDWSARTGTKAMTSFAAIMPPDGAGPNNDWLISPQIQLVASGNKLKFWAKTCDGTYSEKFKVGISAGGSATTDFTVISPGTSVTAPNAWTEFVYDLDAYANQNIRFSINCVSSDQFGFAIDDVSVIGGGTAGVNDILTAKLSVFPNPANDMVTISNGENILINSVEVVDINGRIVKSSQFDGVTEAKINISNLSSGLYMMNISSDKGTATKKIMKN